MANLTLEKIAELSGVSRSTVSRVVRNHKSVRPEVRERVLQVIAETGYRPNAAAQMLAGQRTNIIGLVVAEPASAIFNDEFFYSQIIQGITQESNHRNQTIALFLWHDSTEQRQLSQRLVHNQLVDGLIVCGRLLNDPLVPILLETNIPFVLVGPHEDSRVNFVDVENYRASKVLISHLAQLGHKKIAYIAGPANHPEAQNRLQGFNDAMSEAGLAVNEKLLKVSNDFTEKSGYVLAQDIVAQKVDAIAAASDSLAFGAMRAIEEVGLTVPDDIAVVGFDDVPAAAEASPGLTTIHQDILATSQQSVRTLLEIIESADNYTRQIYLPAELIIRGSCGAKRPDNEPT